MKLQDVTQQDWQDALYSVWEQFEHWYSQTDLSIVYADSPGSMPHHGCPPPLPPADDHRTVTFWQGRQMLWCDPAVWGEEIDLVIPEGHEVQVACAGTMYWFVIHAFKQLGLEDQIPRSTIELFKRRTLENPVDGFANVAVSAKWASEVTTEVEEIQFGDLVGIQRNGRIHHWCIAWCDPHGESEQGKPVLRVMGAAPRGSEDGCVVGLEERDKVWRGRTWVAAKMFR